MELQKQSRQLRLAKQLEWSMSSGTARYGAQPSLHYPPLDSVSTPKALATPSPVIRTAVTSNLPTVGAVESSSHLAGQGDVLQKDGVAYSVNLALKDTAINADKFYRMSVVQSRADAKLCWLVKCWGRTGSAGQCSVSSPIPMRRAVEDFMKHFKVKTGVSFTQAVQDPSQANGGTSGKKKYCLTEVEKKVQQHGGRLADSQTVTFALAWSARADLDIHLFCPDGRECSYRTKMLANDKGETFCELDIDKQAHHYPDQVENIYINSSLAPKGEYIAKVKLYSDSQGAQSIPFDSTAQIASPIPFRTTFNNRASGELQAREVSAELRRVKEEIEIARFVL